MMELCAGAMGAFRNPPAHRPIDYVDPTEAAGLYFSQTSSSGCSTVLRHSYRPDSAGWCGVGPIWTRTKREEVGSVVRTPAPGGTPQASKRRTRCHHRSKTVRPQPRRSP